MKLSNDVYDKLKFMVTVFIPALATFIGTIGVAIGYPEITGTLVTVISAFGLFVGSLIGLSSVNYYGDEDDKIL